MITLTAGGGPLTIHISTVMETLNLENGLFLQTGAEITVWKKLAANYLTAHVLFHKTQCAMIVSMHFFHNIFHNFECN